jgi:hypothetical protein
MFGPRITTVFRSKWRALWFVASVLIGVYFTIPREGDKADGDAQADVQALAGLFGQGQPAQPAHHVNPWAKKP